MCMTEYLRAAFAPSVDMIIGYEATKKAAQQHKYKENQIKSYRLLASSACDSKTILK